MLFNQDEMCLLSGTNWILIKAVTRRALTGESRVLTKVRPCGICGEQSGRGTGSSQCTSVFPLSLSLTSGSSTCCSRQKRKDEDNALSDIWVHLVERYCHILFVPMRQCHGPGPLSFYESSILIFILKLLLLPERQTNENWEP
jgi:hypothetical protein